MRERARPQHGLSLRCDLDVAELRLDEAVRDLHVDADTDAERPRITGLAAALLLLAQRLVARGLEREVERAPVVARVVAGARSGRQGERVRREEVASAHLGRVETELGHEEVHRALDRLRGFGSPRAAERSRRGRVRDDADRVGLDLRDRVDAARHQRGEAGQDGAEPRVGAGVLDDAQPVRLRVAVAAPAELELEHRGAAVLHRDHVLAAGLRPADRSPVLRASHGTITVSTLSPFAPNPPPTSGATTRTPSSPRPRKSPSTWRSRCGVCVESHRVIRPSSPSSATHPRASSGQAASRWLTSRPETTTSQPSNSALSGASSGWLAQTFVPSSGYRSTSPASAASGSTTAGRGS